MWNGDDAYTLKIDGGAHTRGGVRKNDRYMGLKTTRTMCDAKQSLTRISCGTHRGTACPEQLLYCFLVCPTAAISAAPTQCVADRFFSTAIVTVLATHIKSYFASACLVLDTIAYRQEN